MPMAQALSFGDVLRLYRVAAGLTQAVAGQPVALVPPWPMAGLPRSRAIVCPW